MSDFKFGVCTSFKNHDRLLQAKLAGADYIEAGFADLASASESEIDEFVDFLKSENLICLAANSMFPSSLRLTGPTIDFVLIDEYLDKASRTFNKIGGKIVVFGSGGARRFTEDWSHEKATEDLVKVCADHISPYFRKHGLTCVIEPLCKNECNIINTASEGFELCKTVNKDEIRLLIDLYHFDVENEPLESILNYKEYLKHIHVANADNDRKYPKLSDTKDYKQFFDMLRRIDYDGFISLEGRCDDFAVDVKEAFDVLRNL